MGFGIFRPKRSPARRTQLDIVDPVILHMGQATDQILLESLAQLRADSIAVQDYIATSWEKEFPGYRRELNRQRTLMGLPPL